jgi:type IV pilus assembly protein PilN
MIRINLLPQEERVQKKKLALPGVATVAPIAVVGLFLAAVVGITVMERSKIASLKRDIARAEEEARRLKPQIDKVNELTRQREELNTRLQIIQDLDQGRFHTVRVLDGVASDIPGYLWLTAMRDQGGSKLTLEGVTFSNLVVADLMMRLDRSELFDNVDLVVTQKGSIDARSVTKFTVTAGITPGATAKPPAGPVASLLNTPGEDGHGF